MRWAWLWRRVLPSLLRYYLVLALVSVAVALIRGSWRGLLPAVALVLIAPVLTAGVARRSRLTVEEGGLRERWLGGSRLVAWSEVQGVRRTNGVQGLGLVPEPPARRQSGLAARLRAGFLQVEPYDAGFPASGPVAGALREHRPDLGV